MNRGSIAARASVVACGALAFVGAGLRAEAHARESPPAFAAPWAIIAHGPRLEKSVTMVGWHENLNFMLSLSQPGTPATALSVLPRPYVELALFWGPEWKHLQGSPAAVARLKPEQANQHARFYPAQGDAPAAVVFGPPQTNAIFATVHVRVVDAKGLAVLSAQGIPVRLAP